MKYSDLNNKGIQELQEELREEKIKLGKLRFELANKALKDSSQISKVKRDIARLLTAIVLKPSPTKQNHGK